MAEKTRFVWLSAEEVHSVAISTV